MGVDTGGAGDQGLMFGYVGDENDEVMPMAIQLAHGLTRRVAVVRKNGVVGFLRPDGKSQVTVEYRRGQPARVDCVVVSTQHSESVSNSDLRDAVMNEVIRPVIPASMMDKQTKFHINPTGRFVIGGPMGGAGVTGRKIIVDTYGGFSPPGGGGAFGRKPTQSGRACGDHARSRSPKTVGPRRAR